MKVAISKCNLNYSITLQTKSYPIEWVKFKYGYYCKDFKDEKKNKKQFKWHCNQYRLGSSTVDNR